jgi:GT2 family glycosyltransferase
MTNSITVAIPSIPPRENYLKRAIASVMAQTLLPDHISVAVDDRGEGAPATRNRAWRAYDSEWVAFLDDDDELLPHHLEHLVQVADETGADMVYPWHTIIGPWGEPLGDFLGAQGIPFDPVPLFGGDPATIDADDFDPNNAGQARNYIPITNLVRRSLLVEVGGFWARPGEAFEDWRLWRRLVKAGAKIVHTPEITWIWHHHGQNTEGRPSRWQVNAPGMVEAPL